MLRLALSVFAISAITFPAQALQTPTPDTDPLGPQVHQLAEHLTALGDAFLSDLYAAQTAYIASLAPPAPPTRQTATQSASRGTVGECTGFAIPDYIIQRESGGNASAYNPSGAYGCAQTLLSHYSRGSCSGLDPYTIDGQRECVDILSNGGTNLQPWAETR